jgi:hypothetical protein
MLCNTFWEYRDKAQSATITQSLLYGGPGRVGVPGRIAFRVFLGN